MRGIGNGLSLPKGGLRPHLAPHGIFFPRMAFFNLGDRISMRLSAERTAEKKKIFPSLVVGGWSRRARELAVVANWPSHSRSNRPPVGVGGSLLPPFEVVAARTLSLVWIVPPVATGRPPVDARARAWRAVRLGHDTLPSAKAGGMRRRVEGLVREDKLVRMVQVVRMMHTRNALHMLHTRHMRNGTQRYRARVTTCAPVRACALRNVCLGVSFTYGQPHDGTGEAHARGTTRHARAAHR